MRRDEETRREGERRRGDDSGESLRGDGERDERRREEIMREREETRGNLKKSYLVKPAQPLTICESIIRDDSKCMRQIANAIDAVSVSDRPIRLA